MVTHGKSVSDITAGTINGLICRNRIAVAINKLYPARNTFFHQNIGWPIFSVLDTIPPVFPTKKGIGDPAQMKRRLISWAITAAAACIIVIISLTTTSATGAEIEDRGAQAHRPNILGFNVALYNNRFIDDVISPVVYAASSPLFEFSYRNENDVRGHTARVEFGFYGAGLEDFDGNDYFEIPVVDGGVYNYPRSLTNLDGTHFEAEYFYRRRALTFESGRSSLHLGAGGQFLVEEITGTDYWSAEFSWERTKSWSYDLSLALGAGVERRMRERDLLLLDLRFTAVSVASRAPAYCAISYSVDPNFFDVDVSWMFPTEFFRWSATLSYELWMSDSFGVEAHYRFLNQRVSEYRALGYVSHTLSLGVRYAL